MTRKHTYAWARVLIIKNVFQNMSSLKLFFHDGLLLHQIATWSLYWGKFVAKKTTIPYKGMNYFIFVPFRSDVRLSASFLVKEEKSSLHLKYFSFNDSSGKYLFQTWWYHGFWRSNKLEMCFTICHSIDAKRINTLCKMF